MSNNFTFNNTPVLKRSRSKFNLSHGHKTSANTGELFPFMAIEVLPGDSFKINTDFVARVTSSFIKPIMDNAYIDIHYFFVPNRLCYDRWEEVMGENKYSEWISNQEIENPELSAGTVSSNTVADHLGLRPGNVPAGLNPFKFRAFALIYNQWFRDQNNVTPTYVHTGAIGNDEKFNNNDWAPDNYFGKLPKVTKFKDMFTSCLPAPQKSEPVGIPLGSFANVITRDENHSIYGNVPLRFGRPNIAGFPGYSNGYYFPSAIGIKSGTGTGMTNYATLGVEQESSPATGGQSFIDLAPLNLYADLQTTQIAVNDFRYAVQLQKMYERDARGGTRYREYLSSAFGVTSPDSRLQIPEYLGGRRTPVQVQQVAQTSQASEDSPLGNLAGYSQTIGNGQITKSFVEHGFLFGVACIRQKHTYQQGIDKSWFRKNRLDYYDPVFANIGEQPIYKQQLFTDASKSLREDIFGYNEAWVEYRSIPSSISGDLRSNIPQTLDIWHFADNYGNAPTLTAEFVNETDKYIDRTLSVESSVQNQFIIDFYSNISAIRVMPTYSIPSLVDHN